MCILYDCYFYSVISEIFDFSHKYFSKFLVRRRVWEPNWKSFSFIKYPFWYNHFFFFLFKIKNCFSYTFSGNPAFWYFCLILFNSLLKSDVICLARCSSSLIALRLYLTEIFALQCTGNFVDLLKTGVVISPFSLTDYASRNFAGLTSNVSLIFSLWEFSSLESL